MDAGHDSGYFGGVESKVVDELDLSEEADEVAEEAAARSLAAAIAKAHGVRASLSAQRLLEILSNPNVSMNEVTRTIEIDSSLAARVLRVVNSSVYGMRVRVRKISLAVTLLGAKKLNEIATAAAVLDWFEHDSLTAPEIFRHSSATAALARHIATRCGLPAEEMYTCGLLHDYGKLILVQTGDESYAQLIATTAHDDDIYLKERALFGYDHAILGARMLAEWNLPEPLPSVIALHHQPARAFKLGGNLGRMVAALRWAERLAHEFDRALPIDDAWLADMARDESVRHLALARGDFRALCLDLHLTWLESQQATDLDDFGDERYPEATFASALGGVTEAVAQRAKHGWGRPKSFAVAIGVASLALGGADAIALVNGHLARGQIALLLRSMNGVMGMVALVVAVIVITRRAIFAVSRRR